MKALVGGRLLLEECGHTPGMSSPFKRDQSNA
jgi:hypothetical protein